ncbi:hypothetical protein AB0L82_42220 [Nocardia sp. NPDC052001]|uniref:hypothetical protein n=1 Tax=Nocardia sp. NPDC052001 TaxID=3154853 RepID=UPI0034483216
MPWNRLEDIDEVRPIGDGDAACVDEIRGVEKYGNLERFGVALLRSHFQIGEDEMMLGTTDVKRREHWVRPVSKSDLEGRGLPAQTTIVRFDASGYSQYCGCLQVKHGHTGRHT